MTEQKEEKPPFLKNWRNVYLLVIVTEAVIIITLYFFTLYFK